MVGVGLTAVAGGLAIAGSFMPWARYTVGFIDWTQSPTGFAHGGEGEWTLTLGVILLLLAAASLRWSERRTPVGLLVIAASVVCGIVMLIDVQETNRSLDETLSTTTRIAREAGLEDFDAEVTGGAEAGTWTIFAAAAFGVLGGALLMAARREEPAPSVSYTSSSGTRPAPVASALDTKICPRCAEEVKAAAQVCRYCGHEFAEAQSG